MWTFSLLRIHAYCHCYFFSYKLGFDMTNSSLFGIASIPNGNIGISFPEW